MLAAITPATANEAKIRLAKSRSVGRRGDMTILQGVVFKGFIAEVDVFGGLVLRRGSTIK